MRVVMPVLRHCGSGRLRLPDGPDGVRLSPSRGSSKVDRLLRRTLQPLRVCHCWIMFLVQKLSLDCAHQSLMVEPSSRYRHPDGLASHSASDGARLRWRRRTLQRVQRLAGKTPRVGPSLSDPLQDRRDS